jgi:hypothetical protein
VTGARVAARQSVRRAVLNRVRGTVLAHQRVTRARQEHPVLPPDLLEEWRHLLERTRPLLAAALPDLLSEVFATSPADLIPDDARRRRNGKQLLPSDLKRLLAHSARYVCHRTDREDVGTCRSPVTAAADRRPVAVRAVIGVRGRADGGRYGVVFARYGNLAWTVRDGSAVLCEVESLSTEEAVGWYLREDLDAALGT